MISRHRVTAYKRRLSSLNAAEKYKESAENTEVVKPPGRFLKHLGIGPIIEVSGTVALHVKIGERFRCVAGAASAYPVKMKIGPE
jgi:hypothetical protein